MEMEVDNKRSIIDRITLESEKIENLFVVKVVRNGLISMIPILMIGAFALVLQSFPWQPYQYFITDFAGGFLYSIFHMIYTATFGFMSLYMAICFSVSYFAEKDPEKPVNLWGVGSAVVSFLIMIGVWNEEFSMSDLGATSVFLAIVTSLISSSIYYLHTRKFIALQSRYSLGADSGLNSAMAALMPAAVTIIIAALISFFVSLLGFGTMHEMITSFFLFAFNLIDNLFAKGLCFIFVSSLLWLFGIHGSDCLQGVSDSVFSPLMDANLAAAANNTTPTEILCKPFFDCYILMGGCGSSICLFLAIMFFSKNKSMKTIAEAASLPLLFNINELLVFGLPIVFNPALAIPFLLVPVLQYLIAYGATASGLVPCISNAVEWTTPVLISGYAATGSFSAVLLQLINIAVGVAIYAPFVNMMGRVKQDREDKYREDFVQWYISHEAEAAQIHLLTLNGVYGEIAKRMALELKDAVKEEKFELYYQPQYHYDGHCMGVEALLRWPSIPWLKVYPPLIIQIANEQGILMDMEKRILHRAMSEREAVFAQFGRGIKISVNVTGSSIANQEYWDYLKAEWAAAPFTEGSLCVEVTEQASIIFSEELLEEFRSCRELGIRFAIDDFSAGQTSMEYLKNGIFDMLKLDGSLVKVINENQRISDIISSLVTLSDSLHIDCLAEYVENDAIRQKLHAIGCDLYQGYLYSPALPLNKK